MFTKRECQSKSLQLVKALKSDLGGMVEGRGDLLKGAFDIILDEFSTPMALTLWMLSRSSVVDLKAVQAARDEYDTKTNTLLKAHWIGQGSPGSLERFLAEADGIRRHVSGVFQRKALR